MLIRRASSENRKWHEGFCGVTLSLKSHTLPFPSLPSGGKHRLSVLSTERIGLLFAFLGYEFGFPDANQVRNQLGVNVSHGRITVTTGIMGIAIGDLGSSKDDGTVMRGSSEFGTQIRQQNLSLFGDGFTVGNLVQRAGRL